MRLVDPLKHTKIYFLYVRTQSATCGVGLCPMTLPCISSGLRLSARRHDILNLIFVCFKSIRPVKPRIYKNKSSFDLVIFANFLPRIDRHYLLYTAQHSLFRLKWMPNYVSHEKTCSEASRGLPKY